MFTTCTCCGKKFPQSEKDVDTDRNQICFRCALTELTADYDTDQEPDVIDIENAWNRTTQAMYEELCEIKEERRRYPENSDNE